MSETQNSNQVVVAASPCSALRAVVDAARIALTAAEAALAICEALNAPTSEKTTTEN